MWKASFASTPSVARLNRRAISFPETLPRAGSSSWMKVAPASTRALSPALITCAGPSTFGSRIRPNNVYKDTLGIAEELAHVITGERKAPMEAGGPFLQLDEPVRGNGP